MMKRMRRSKIDIEKVKSLRAKGLSQFKIADIFDVEQQTIAAAIKRHLENGGSMEKTELTEEEYMIACKNGIPRNIAKHRFEMMFWDWERAITQPVKKIKSEKGKQWEQWEDLAKENGVDRTLFFQRIKDGMDEHTAATKPRRKTIPKHLVERAKANGITYNALRKRLHQYKWPELEAVTRPLSDKEYPGGQRGRGH